MDTQQPSRRIPKIRFRVLIIGRANAGKTSILQRVCDTTDSPIIYQGKEKVTLDPSVYRGEHSIEDELMFSNHKGYIFHDSRGIESCSIEELWTLQEFIRRKCRETRLEDKLHAIWFGISSVHTFAVTTTDDHVLRYCVPMDNQRPQLDLRFFKDICPDRNVPVIVVFTKYDQFRRNVQIHVEDFGSPDDNVLDVEDKQFQEHYLRPLGDDITFVRLEKMHMQNMRCDKLIETTAAALNDDIVGLMLLAVQRGNVKLSVTRALNRVRPHTGSDRIVLDCLISFPYIWLFGSRLRDDLSGYPEVRERFRLGRLQQFRRETGRELRFVDEEQLERELQDSFVKQIMSLPTIQNLTHISLGDYHLIFAVILILKHATFLRLSNMSPQAALTYAEVDYREAKIDSRIRQYLTAPSQEHSVELFADFIIATDMTCTHIGVSGDGSR